MLHVLTFYPQKLVDLNNNPSQLYKMPVHEYMDLYVKDKIL